MHLPRPVVTLLRRQDGLVARRQLTGQLSQDQIDRRCRSGQWAVVRPGVYRTAETVLTPRARIRAAWLSAGPVSWVSGTAPGYWWELTDRAPATVEVTIPRRRCPDPRPGVRLLRRDLDPFDLFQRNGIGVTALAFTALALGLSGPGGPALLDRALQTSVSLPMLTDVVDRYPTARWRGRAHRLLTSAADGEAESERMLIAGLRSAGLGGWEAHYRVDVPGGHVVIDLAFVRQRVAIEVDGWAWHHSPERFARDRRKQNALVLQGWTVLRFTWFDLVEHPERVLAEIRTALAGR